MLNAFVIEDVRNATGASEKSHAIAEDQRSGMIDLELLTAVQHDRERAVWCAILKHFQRLIEVFDGHVRVPTVSSTKYTPFSAGTGTRGC